MKCQRETFGLLSYCRGLFGWQLRLFGNESIIDTRLTADQPLLSKSTGKSCLLGVCGMCVSFCEPGGNLYGSQVGQIIARGDRRWLIRVYLGRDQDTTQRICNDFSESWHSDDRCARKVSMSVSAVLIFRRQARMLRLKRVPGFSRFHSQMLRRS